MAARARVLVFSLFSFATLSVACFADDFTWTGAGDGSTWSDPANWTNTSPSGAASFPDGDDAVLFNSDAASTSGAAASVAIGASSTFSLAPGTLTIGGLMNSGSFEFLGSGSSTDETLAFSGEVTLGGVGQLVLVESADSVIQVNNQTVTNAAGHTIRGTGAFRFFSSSPTFVNEGTLLVEAGGIEFNGGSTSTEVFTNSGVVSIAPGETFRLIGFNGITTESLGDIQYGTGSTLEVASGSIAFELSGEGVDMLEVGGDFSLASSTLNVQLAEGSSIASSGGFQIIDIAGNQTGTFNGLAEGAFVGNYGADLFITYAAGDGNDIALVAAPTLGAVNYNFAGPNDSAYFFGTRPGSTETQTLEYGSLDLIGGAFTLGPNETLVLNDGPLVIGAESTFIGNGVIQGSVINNGLMIIPIVPLPPAQVAPVVNTGTIQATIPALGSYASSGGLVTYFAGGGGAIGGGVSVGNNTVWYLAPSNPTVPNPSPVGSVTVSGDFSIDQSHASLGWDADLEITGSYTQSESGVLRLFIGGNDLPGTNYSQLVIGEEATVEGRIELVLAPQLFTTFAYAPEAGDTFDLLIADGGINLDLSMLDFVNLVTDGGDLFIDQGLSFSEYDSGFSFDPNTLLSIDQDLFTLSLEAGDTILRATLNQSLRPLGDFNGDLVVDVEDYSLWRSGFGGPGQADANGDGRTDAADYAVWRNHLGVAIGDQSPDLSAVPEPTACGLMFSASFFLVRRKRLPDTVLKA